MSLSPYKSEDTDASDKDRSVSRNASCRDTLTGEDEKRLIANKISRILPE